MSNLPVVAGLEELQATNTDNRQRLQKSLRSGLLNVVKSVQSLENTMVNIARAQMEQQQLANFAALEAAREASRGDQGSRKKADVQDVGKLELSSLALPAIVAFWASATGFDAWIKALKMPEYFRNLKTAVSASMDAIKTIRTGFDSVKDTVKALRWADIIPTFKLIDFKDLTFADNLKSFSDDIKGVFKGIFQTAKAAPSAAFANFGLDLDLIVNDIKTNIKNFFQPVTDKVNSTKAAITEAASKFETPKFFENLKTTINNIKAKLTFTMPTWVSEFSFSSITDKLEPVKNFLNKVLGVFTKIGDMITKVPGLKGAVRLVGGPVTAAIISIIDFFTGFYKSFVGDLEPKYDEFGDVIPDDRSFLDKFFDGLEGGFLGLVKGITEAIDLIFIKLPAWLLEKVGLEDAADFLRGFSLTELVDPIWNGIKNIFKFFSDPEFRAEQVSKFKDSFIQMFENAVGSIKEFFSDLLDSVNPKNWFSDGEELTEQQEARKVLVAEMANAATEQNFAAMNEINRQLMLLDEGAISTRAGSGRSRPRFTRDVNGDGRISSDEIFKTIEAALRATVPTDGGEVLLKSAEQAGGGGLPPTVAVGGTAIDARTTLSQFAPTTVAVPASSKQNNPRRRSRF
jgi:hypothetical protein